MLQILSRAWRYENGHICATVDFFAGDKIFFYDEEWSMTRSIPGLCGTLWGHHGIQPPHTEPLFICACGNPMCTFSDYFVKHECDAGDVLLSDFTHMGKEMHFPSLKLMREEYAVQVLKLFSEFAEFEKVSLKIEGKDEKDGLSINLRDRIMRDEKLSPMFSVLEERKFSEDAPSGDIRQLLVKAQFNDLQLLARNFPWKLQDVHPCLYDVSEIVRYKTCLFLGASKLTDAAAVLFDKLADESFAVSFAACRALSELQILQPFQFMDDLYARKTNRGGGCPKHKRLSYKLREDRYLPFLVFLREGKEGDIPPLLKALEKLPFEKQEPVVDAVLSFVENKSLPLPQRQQSLQLLKRANMNPIFPVLLENFQYGKEQKAFRVSLFHFLKEYPLLEIVDGFKRVADSDSDEEMRQLCRDFLYEHRANSLLTPHKKFRLWLAADMATALLLWSLFHFSLPGFFAAAVFFLAVFFAIINK